MDNRKRSLIRRASRIEVGTANEVIGNPSLELLFAVVGLFVRRAACRITRRRLAFIGIDPALGRTTNGEWASFAPIGDALVTTAPYTAASWTT
jgi:hypothetical protein